MQILVLGFCPVKQSIQLVRQQILDFSHRARPPVGLDSSPIGSGKSTIARLIGLLKRVAPLNVDEATRMAITDVKFDAPNRIDIRLLE
ncbi:MAG: hypothetical protein IPH55_06655 [Betaproteobacteria bacterium]|nr:hypothetical protein [Betaproteobacteria bacterium]